MNWEMEIWTSPRLGMHGRRTMGTAGKILGIVLLGMGLLSAGTILAIRMQWPMETVSLILCISVTLLLVGLAAGLGRRARQDTLLFCKDDADRLFVADVRKYVPYRRGIWGYAEMDRKTEHILRNLLEPGGVWEHWLRTERSLVGVEPQVLAVERLRENRRDYGLVCLLRYPGGRIGRQSFQLVKGYEREERLIRELERRRRIENPVEWREDRKPLGIFLSGTALVLCVAVCVFSHPAVGMLDAAFYFPFLGAAGISLILLGFFLVKRRRGE